MEGKAIDVRDICIGSYVSCGVNVYEIQKIGPKTVSVGFREASGNMLIWKACDLSNYEGISITKAWLKRLGITMQLGLPTCYAHPDPSQNWVVEFSDHVCQLWDGEWHQSFEYVHELQALVWHIHRFWLSEAKQAEAVSN